MKLAFQIETDNEENKEIENDKKEGEKTNEDEKIWTVFNGEIYNYKSLQDDLKSKGHKFKTNSDTETIVHAYEEYDLDFVNHLQGMFAIAIWDEKRNRTILVRDRLGVKPLYYYIKNDRLLFASELKVLLEYDVLPSTSETTTPFTFTLILLEYSVMYPE